MAYIIQRSEGTTCPKCKTTAHLLCRDGQDIRPAFYICWECQTVAQVGVGPVKGD